MKIVLMVTADYAAVEPQTGKLNILGVFNRIDAHQFPAIHPRMYLAAMFEKEMADPPGPYRLTVTLVEEDGVSLVSISGSFSMQDGSFAVPPQHGIVFEMNDLGFKQPGEYRLHITVNEGELVEESMILQLILVE